MEFTEVEVVGPQGRLALGDLRVAADEPELLLVPIEAGWHAGEIEVRWRTVGADGHLSSGSFSFRVPEGAEGLPAELEPALHSDEALQNEVRPIDPRSPLYAGIRWMTLVALIGMIGAVVFRAGVPIPSQAEVGGWRGARRRRKPEGSGCRDRRRSPPPGGRDRALHSPPEANSPAALVATLGLQPWGSGYGRTLLLKLALVAAVFGMGDREIDARGAELMVLAYEYEVWSIKAIHWSSRARQT